MIDEKFTVQISGYYEISATMHHARPTGKFEEVPNPDFKWWTFWLPKTVTREIWDYSESKTGRQVVYAKAGDRLEMPVIRLT